MGVARLPSIARATSNRVTNGTHAASAAITCYLLLETLSTVLGSSVVVRRRHYGHLQTRRPINSSSDTRRCVSESAAYDENVNGQVARSL